VIKKQKKPPIDPALEPLEQTPSHMKTVKGRIRINDEIRIFFKKTQAIGRRDIFHLPTNVVARRRRKRHVTKQMIIKEFRMENVKTL
jgi:hypothetical protein